MSVFTNLLGLQSPETKTLSSDTLTPTRSKVLVTSQTGTTDNLATINVSGFTGLTDGSNTFHPIVILRATPTHTITVKHNTGNIVLYGGADIALSGNKILTLVYDSVVLKWMNSG